MLESEPAARDHTGPPTVSLRAAPRAGAERTGPSLARGRLIHQVPPPMWKMLEDAGTRGYPLSTSAQGSALAGPRITLPSWIDRRAVVDSDWPLMSPPSAKLIIRRKGLRTKVR